MHFYGKAHRYACQATSRSVKEVTHTKVRQVHGYYGKRILGTTTHPVSQHASRKSPFVVHRQTGGQNNLTKPDELRNDFSTCHSGIAGLSESGPRGPRESHLDVAQHRAYIALGSNVGDGVANIEAALQNMMAQGIKIIRTSFLYETSPMYLEEQDRFTNGVCEVETLADPLGLLGHLKDIEKELGREKTIENGPRTIDLDILLYDDQIYESPELSIPHKRIQEREFVLRPLCDLIPDVVAPNVPKSRSFINYLREVKTEKEPLSPLTRLSGTAKPLRSQASTRPTGIMAIINLTPDSFSDGGLHYSGDPSTVISSLVSKVGYSDNPRIIDIGGQSTRPRAPAITSAVERSRIMPAIKAIRNESALREAVISVDTYRASVARTAIEAGANIVNDVSAGLLDADMLPTIAELGCTCILMHMRGTPETMSSLTEYPDGIIEGVGRELRLRVQAAEAAGIRRWRIILDPGIGFAKTQAQNLELLRRFDELRDFEGLRGYPWVLGPSRKGFIGKITGVEDASKRQWGTAACITAAVKGGADLVRVHDVAEMQQVVQMADAIYRV